MMKIFDSPYRVTRKPLNFTGNKEDSKLKRNTAVGTASGMLLASLILTKGKLKNINKIKYEIPQVMTLCIGSALGGYIGANLTTKENKRGRKIELENQLIFNDLLPLIVMEGVNKVYKTSNKLAKSVVLAGSLLVSTFAGHKLAEQNLKHKGLKQDYPVESAHIIAELDDYLLPVAVATKSKGLQNFLKVISPLTFFPLGMSIGKTKDNKYYA